MAIGIPCQLTDNRFEVNITVFLLLKLDDHKANYFLQAVKIRKKFYHSPLRSLVDIRTIHVLSLV